jgi:hypothetical protein
MKITLNMTFINLVVGLLLFCSLSAHGAKSIKTIKDYLDVLKLTSHELPKLLRFKNQPEVVVEAANRNYNKPLASSWGVDDENKELILSNLIDFQTVRNEIKRLGYELVPSERSFEIKWVPIKRSKEDFELLKKWGFTDKDIQELTIANIRDPLSNPLRGYGFFDQKLGWPTGVSEADILLLAPRVLEKDPCILNNMRYEGRYILNGLRYNVPFGTATYYAKPRIHTILGIAILENYKRAAALLLQQPTIDVNKSPYGSSTPLELAIESNHPEMVTLLLAHPNIKITGRAQKLAKEKPEIEALLLEAIALRDSGQSSSDGSVKPDFESLLINLSGETIPMAAPDKKEFDLMDYAKSSKIGKFLGDDPSSRFVSPKKNAAIAFITGLSKYGIDWMYDLLFAPKKSVSQQESSENTLLESYSEDNTTTRSEYEQEEKELTGNNC